MPPSRRLWRSAVWNTPTTPCSPGPGIQPYAIPRRFTRTGSMPRRMTFSASTRLDPVSRCAVNSTGWTRKGCSTARGRCRRRRHRGCGHSSASRCGGTRRVQTPPSHGGYQINSMSSSPISWRHSATCSPRLTSLLTSISSPDSWTCSTIGRTPRTGTRYRRTNGCVFSGCCGSCPCSTSRSSFPIGRFVQG